MHPDLDNSDHDAPNHATSDLDTLQAQHLDALEAAYATLLAQQDLDGVLLYSGHPHYHFADDQQASFVTYAHFQHWVPLPDLSHSWLLIRPGQRPRLYFHAPDDFWHLPAQLPSAPWVSRFAVTCGRFDEAPPTLPEGRFALLGEVTPAQAEALGASLNPSALTAALDEQRLYKSPYEITCLREANRRAMHGHHAARDAFLSGGSELDVQLAYLAASRQRESATPYANIIAINTHAGVLHYQHYDHRAPDRRLSVLVDAGHRYRGYCADITRTWAGDAADPSFVALIEAMTALKDRLVAQLAPDVDFVDLHRRMHRALGELLVEQRLVRCSAEAAVADGLTRAFCPHGLGHSLGLQVHDVAGRCRPDGTPLPPPASDPALRLTRPLRPGMVVTIEPGLYGIPMLLEPLRQAPAGQAIDWARVERLLPHGGIRIEDNVAITAHGADNLTPGQPA